MRILYITPANPFLETPETQIAKELEKRGHEVTFTFGFNPELLKKEFDIVFGAMEYSMNLGDMMELLMIK